MSGADTPSQQATAETATTAAAGSAGNVGAMVERAPPSLSDMDRLSREMAELERDLQAAGSSLPALLRQIAKQIIGPF